MREHLDDDALADLSLARVPALVQQDHLSGCPACSSRLASFGRVVAAARPGAAGDLLQPPPHLWARVALEAGVPADPGAAPVRAVRPASGPAGGPAARRLRPRRRLPVLLAAAAAVGLLVGGGATWLAVGSGSSRDDARVLAAADLRPLAGTTVPGEAQVDRTGGARRLVVDARLPGAGRQYYEVWLIDPDDGRLVSLGVLPSGDDAPLRLAVPADVDLSAYRTVDVSLESADGDPGHSGRSVLRGTLLPET